VREKRGVFLTLIDLSTRFGHEVRILEVLHRPTVVRDQCSRTRESRDRDDVRIIGAAAFLAPSNLRREK
jgi:hypothetical protein